MSAKLQTLDQNFASNDLLQRLLKLLPKNLYLQALLKVMKEQFGGEKPKPSETKSFEQELKIPGSPAQKKAVNELIAVYLVQVMAYSVKQMNFFQFMLKAILEKILLLENKKSTVSKSSKAKSHGEVWIEGNLKRQYQELERFEQRLKELDLELQKNKNEYGKLIETFEQEESKLKENYLLRIDDLEKTHQKNLQSLSNQKTIDIEMLETNYVEKTKELTVNEEHETNELIKKQQIEREKIKNSHKISINELTLEHINQIASVKQNYTSQIIILGQALVGDRQLEVEEKEVLSEVVMLLSKAKNFMEEINILSSIRERLGLEPGLTPVMAKFNKLLIAEAEIVKSIDSDYALKKEALKNAYLNKKYQLKADFEISKQELYQDYQQQLKLLSDKNTTALDELKNRYKSREHELCERYEHNLQSVQQKYHEEQHTLLAKKETAVGEILVKIIEIESQMQYLVKDGINLYQKSQQNFIDQSQTETTNDTDKYFATPYNTKLKPTTN